MRLNYYFITVLLIAVLSLFLLESKNFKTDDSSFDNAESNSQLTNDSFNISKISEGLYETRIPSENFIARFESKTISIHKNMPSLNNNSIKFALIEFGYGDYLDKVHNAVLQSENNRIEYRREGLTEWYVNTPMGIEQGFTVHKRPSGKAILSDSGALIFKLSVDTPETLKPVKTSGKSLMWKDIRDGYVLHYRGLYVYDAHGKELNSNLILADNEITIEVNDKNAVYPVVVDPYIQIQKITEDLDANSSDLYGRSLAADGDTLVVGSFGSDVGGNTNQGYAYIYERDMNGMFVKVIRLTVDVPTIQDNFGISTAVDGNTVMIGAQGVDLGGGITGNQGALYIYERDVNGDWNQVQKLTVIGNATNNFGQSVSLDGNRAIVGASRAHAVDERVGAAYIIEKDGNGLWSIVQKLTASDGVDFNNFAFQVSIYGDRAVVGDFSKNNFEGAAYIYERDANGFWNEVQKLTESDATDFRYFGRSVSMYNNTAIVGAERARAPNGAQTGAVYVYERNGFGDWNEVQKLTPSFASGIDSLGTFNGIHINGNNIIIGAPSDSINASNQFTGSAYIFKKDTNGVWNENQKLTANDAMAADFFGRGVSITDEYAVVGSAQVDVGANSNQGAIYIFELDSADTDGDGINDNVDNCPDDPNPAQTDTDQDGDGDVCDADDDGDGIDDDIDNCPVDINPGQIDFDGDGQGDVCDPDDDDDGVIDDFDACQESNTNTTVVIDGCGSGVPNIIDGDGCTISDLIEEIAASANNHGKFTSMVSQFLNDLVLAGIISNSDKGAIQSCAGGANIP